MEQQKRLVLHLRKQGPSQQCGNSIPIKDNSSPKLTAPQTSRVLRKCRQQQEQDPQKQLYQRQDYNDRNEDAKEKPLLPWNGRPRKKHSSLLTSSSLSSLLLSLFCVIGCFSLTNGENGGGRKPRTVVTAVPPGATVKINCYLPKDKSTVIQRRWHRASDTRDLFLNDVWLRYPDVGGWPEKSDIYSARTDGNVYALTLRGLTAQEAGEYRCKITTSEGVIRDQTVGIVTVIENPTCSPSPSKLPELREGSPYYMNCSAKVYGGRVKDLQWFVGTRPKPSKREDGDNRATAILEYEPSFKDFGSTARCQTVHPRWNKTYPVGACEYENLVVQFAPRLSCTRNRVAIKKAEDYRIWCNYTSYPTVTTRSFQWLTFEGQSLNHSMHKEVVRKIELGVKAALIVKSQVFDKFDDHGEIIPLSEAQTTKYRLVIRDKAGKVEMDESVSLTLDLNETLNRTVNDSVIGIIKDWRVLIGVLAAFSALVIVIILVIVILKKGFCKSEKSHDLNGTSTEMTREGIGHHELPVGGAFDVAHLDGGTSTTSEGGGTNGGVPPEFYHSGKSKGTLRFDRY